MSISLQTNHRHHPPNTNDYETWLNSVYTNKWMVSHEFIPMKSFQEIIIIIYFFFRGLTLYLRIQCTEYEWCDTEQDINDDDSDNVKFGATVILEVWRATAITGCAASFLTCNDIIMRLGQINTSLRSFFKSLNGRSVLIQPRSKGWSISPYHFFPVCLAQS